MSEPADIARVSQAPPPGHVRFVRFTKTACGIENSTIGAVFEYTGAVRAVLVTGPANSTAGLDDRRAVIAVASTVDVSAPRNDTGPVAADAAFYYRHGEPTGRLRRYVESIWYARGMSDFGSERIAPTGSTVLGIVLGDPLVQTPRCGAGEPYEATEGFVIGPHDEPIVNDPTGVTYCVGIVTTAIGARAALGIDPAPLRGRVVPATGWPAFESVRAVIRGSERDGDPDAVAARALAAVEGALAAGLDESEPALDRCEQVVRALHDDSATPIADIAERLGISHGHLDREFRRVVGMGPRTLSRIMRLRRLVESIDVFGTVAWTDLAAELGWFDQAHLIRDFRRFTGVTPTEYVRAQSVGYRPDDAEPGFVPDLTRPTGV